MILSFLLLSLLSDACFLPLFLKVNGNPLSGSVVLCHKDRVLFGSNHLYVFINPLNTTTSSPDTPETIEWEYAQNEIAKVKGFQVEIEGLSKDQQRVQEQVLELLPLITEANAIRSRYLYLHVPLSRTPS
jgi:kinesin family protein 1